MAAPTSVTAAIAIANSTAITGLSGPVKFIADKSGANAISDGDWIEVRELAVSGDYQTVIEAHKKPSRITFNQPSIILDCYGDYKLLASKAGIGVGYVAG